MKINPKTKLRSVADESIIVLQGKKATDLTYVIGLNESVKDLYNELKNREFTLNDVTQTLLNLYDIDVQTARQGGEKWVTLMREQGLIID